MTSKHKSNKSAGVKTAKKANGKKHHKPVAQPKAPFVKRSREGAIFLVLVLLAASILTGLNFQPSVTLFLAGEIATQDVTANQDLLVEERESTEAKRREVARSQPTVFDLSMSKAEDIKPRLAAIYEQIDNSPISHLKQLRWQIAEQLDSDINRESLDLIRNNEVRNLIFIRVLPWLIKRLQQGVVQDSRSMARYEHGIMVRDRASGLEKLRLDLYQLQDVRSLAESLNIYLHGKLKQPWRVRKAILELIAPLLSPSLILNAEATERRIKEVTAAVDPVYYQIKKGEVIVRAGERVDKQDQLKLQALYNQDLEYFQYYTPIGVFLFALFLAGGLILSPEGRLVRPLNNRDAFFLGCMLLITAIMARFLAEIKAPIFGALLTVDSTLWEYAFPVAGAVGVFALFLSPRICIGASLLVSFISCQMFDAGLELFLFYFISGIGYAVLIKRTQNRKDVLKSVFPLMAGQLLLWGGIVMSNQQSFSSVGIEPLFILFGGVLSLLLALGLAPVVELVMGYSSRFKLMEQMNLEQPLLQELMVAVPGTYHHSLIVANMSEAGARSIGANALLCKVAALYHDIGKLNKPQYFIENQQGIKNPHDKLSPSMSALVLISHVKKGVELAQKHKLGAEIEDIIRQHHGTSVIGYFYNKAMEQAAAKGENVHERDYRYPGPKPQTKEAGIVLLADAIEASGRTLVDPTPARIKGHIQKMMKNIFVAGQLDESELTLKDLHSLEHAFHRILTGIFHQRIEYPNGQKGGEDSKKKQEPVAADKIENEQDDVSTAPHGEPLQ